MPSSAGGEAVKVRHTFDSQRPRMPTLLNQSRCKTAITVYVEQQTICGVSTDKVRI